MSQGMQDQAFGGLFQAGVQGAQNTSRQELMQRQKLFQGIMGAMDDSEWLRQHYPNFFGWTPSGGGGGGYVEGANAPTMVAASNFNMPSRGSSEKGYTPNKGNGATDLGRDATPADFGSKVTPGSLTASSAFDEYERGGSYSHLWS